MHIAAIDIGLKAELRKGTNPDSHQLESELGCERDLTRGLAKALDKGLGDNLRIVNV